MTNKKRITLCITVIILIFLAIIGLTYGYYMTKVNNKSISRVGGDFADISIYFSDGNGLVKPDKVLKPGNVVGTKEFSVVNNGDLKFDNYIVFFDKITNTLVNSNDLVYELTCSSNKGGSCNGKSETAFPTTSSVIVYNSIDSGETQKYSLTVTFKDNGKDQSADMGKTFMGRVNITDAINNVK